MERRFGGEWVGLVRLHPNFSRFSKMLNLPANVIDVTNYSDMQELLLVSDACITDYSSCIFEFSIDGKPGFIYAPDFDAFKQDRDVYYEITDTPFPVSTSLEGLNDSIIKFDENTYAARHKEFYSSFIRLYKCDNSAEKVADIIEEISC